MSAAPNPTLQERCEAFIDWLDETGLASVLLIVAILASVLWVWCSMLTRVHAATLADPGPEPSNVAGLLVALVPVAIAVVLMTFATRGQPKPVDEEAYGDTTGFRERER